MTNLEKYHAISTLVGIVGITVGFIGHSIDNPIMYMPGYFCGFVAGILDLYVWDPTDDIDDIICTAVRDIMCIYLN